MVKNGERDEALSGIIWHRHNNQYYVGQGQWSDDEEKAMEFKSLWDVMAEATKYHIKDCCEFILKLVGHPDLRVLLPL